MKEERNWNPSIEDIVVGATVKTKLTSEPLTVEIPIINEVEVESEDEDGETKMEKVERIGFPLHPVFGQRMSDVGHPIKSRYAFKATHHVPLTKATLDINKEMKKDIKKKLDKLNKKDELTEKEESQVKVYERQIEALGKKTRPVSFYPTMNHIQYVIPPKKSAKKNKK